MRSRSVRRFDHFVMDSHPLRRCRSTRLRENRNAGGELFMRKMIIAILIGSLVLLGGCRKKVKTAEETGPEVVSPAQEAQMSLDGMARHIMVAFRDNSFQRLQEISASRAIMNDLLNRLDRPEYGGKWDPKTRDGMAKTLSELSDSLKFTQNGFQFRDSFYEFSQARRTASRIDWDNAVFQSFERAPDPDGPLFSTLMIRFSSGGVNHVLAIPHVVEYQGKWFLGAPRKLQLDQTGLRMTPKKR
jgi:hypothetical protein